MTESKQPPMFGILNINKPMFATSRAAVNRIQSIVRPEKVGHAGTLDPMATGVLLVAVGRATRLVSRLQDLPKVYKAKFVFGQISDTDDSSGKVESTGRVTPTAAQIVELLPNFHGEIEQVPPAFSAVHVEGKRAYKLARKGVAVELRPRTVRIDRIELLGGGEGAEFEFEIECGSGTYIRSIARDLGQQLGCGALMSALQRTRIGNFTSDAALCIGGGADPRIELSHDDITSALQSPLDALPGMRRHECDAAETRMVRLGRPIRISGIDSDSEIAMISDAGKLVAIASSNRKTGELHPRLVFDSLQ